LIAETSAAVWSSPALQQMLAACALLLMGAVAADSLPPRPITQLVHTKWTKKEGAPLGVGSLAQTPDGYLWLGARSGLVRFDGVRFVSFVPKDGDTLPTVPAIQRLLVSRDSSLWVVWRMGGVSRLRNGRLTTFGERDGLPAAFQLAEGSDGTLVAATIKGLAQFANGKWTDVTQRWGYAGKESRAVWFDRNDVLWVQGELRMFYRPKGAKQFLVSGLRENKYPFRADFAQEADGTTWMAQVSRSAHTLLNAGEDSTKRTEVMTGGAASLLIDRRGMLWIAAYGAGLWRVANPASIRGRTIDATAPEVERFTKKMGLLDDDLETLLEDREGNIWVGGGTGLERFHEGYFTPFPGRGENRSRLVFAGRDTTLWVATFGWYGVQHINARGVRDSINTNFVVQAFAEDARGAVYTVDHKNLWRIDKDKPVVMPLRASQAAGLGYIANDASGTLWVLDDKLGLFRIEHDSLVSVAPVREPVIGHYAMHGDRHGRMWIGLLSEVLLFDGNRKTTFDARHGVPPGIVYDFFEDRKGDLWAASSGGLSRFEKGRFRTISARQGLTGGAVFGLTQDETDNWWLVVREGVIRVPAGDIERAMTDSSYAVRSRAFGVIDGIPGEVPQGFWGAILTRTADGRIWVSSDSGVASIDPRVLKLDAPPPVLIEALRVDGRELSVAEATAIPAGRHDIEIDYTVTNYAAADRLQFRYRLDGADDSWHDAATRRRAYYSGLAPGSYRFRVATTNGDGIWNETGVTRVFRVSPAWYQTMWFRSGVVLIIAGLGAAAAAILQRTSHQRTQRALKREYEATLAERVRIAQDLHDTLLQGFLGVTLGLKAAEFALPAKPDVAADTIRRVQRLARESLREARERVQDMHGSNEASADLPASLEAVAKERTAGTSVEVVASIIGERRRLERRVEDAAFRIGREAVANAVAHAEAKRIEIVTEFATTVFRLEVRDNGKGFSPAEAEDARRDGHFGLTGVRERAATMGGRCEVSARPGGGTVVALELPLSENRAQ
jgi:signal transduction histidine kinase/ligand-binding sensor domain-containing protein